MARLLISLLTFLVTETASGIDVSSVHADKNANGQQVTIVGWEYVSQGNWSEVTIELGTQKAAISKYRGECTRPVEAPLDRETITCRGSKEFPLSGSTFIGKWERIQNRYKYVCLAGCGRSAPKHIYVYLVESQD